MSSSQSPMFDLTSTMQKSLDTLHEYLGFIVVAILVVTLLQLVQTNAIAKALRTSESFGSPRHHAAFVGGTRQRWYGNEITTPGMETDALPSSGDCPSLRPDGSYGFHTRYQSHSPVVAEEVSEKSGGKENMSDIDRKIGGALNSTLNAPLA